MNRSVLIKAGLLSTAAAALLTATSCTERTQVKDAASTNASAADQNAAVADIDTLKKIKESGQIVIGHRESSIPHSYLADGQPVGFTLEVCQKIVESLKVKLNKPDLKVVYQAVNSQNRIPEMQSGHIDLECGTTTNTKKRHEQVDFAINHYVTEVRMLVKKGSGIQELKDLNGKAVVTTLGTTSDRYIKQDESEKIISVTNLFGKDHVDSFAQVASGQAAAFIMDDNILAGLAASSADPQSYEIVGPVFSTEPYGVMLPKGNLALKEIADTAIREMIQSGQMEAAYKKWFQSPIPPKNVNLNLPMSENLKKAFAAPSSEGI